jgi:murein DD-endopeptidase MepM/ murein hydrolase activator NlpD
MVIGNNGGKSFHQGIDVPAANGTPIYPILDGKVIQNSDVGDGYGACVVIEHKVKGKIYHTRYAHMRQDKSAPINVSINEYVVQNKMLGKVGNTGIGGAFHLHFEVSGTNKNKQINPMKQYAKRDGRAYGSNNSTIYNPQPFFTNSYVYNSSFDWNWNQTTPPDKYKIQSAANSFWRTTNQY